MIDIQNNIKNNIYEHSELFCLSNYFDINLLVLDYYNMTYFKGSDYQEDKNKVIIIKYHHHFLPLIHIFGEFPNNLIYK